MEVVFIYLLLTITPNLNLFKLVDLHVLDPNENVQFKLESNL